MGYILLPYALLKWEVKVPERSGLFLMQPNCATWCQRWQQMLESEDRLSGASRQRFQPVCKETSNWRWNMWSGSHWGGGATFVGVRRCDIKRWDNAPASTVKSHDPLYWYWYENIPKYYKVNSVIQSSPFKSKNRGPPSMRNFTVQIAHDFWTSLAGVSGA